MLRPQDRCLSTIRLVMNFMFIWLFFFTVLWFSSMLTGCIKNIFSLDTITSAGYKWMIKVNYDYVSCGILVMLLICFCYVWFYTIHYFSSEERGHELKKIILLFVCVMARLVSTGDFLTTLIFWEYLGVVRFFLILFYSNYLSLRSSIVTLVSSRFGDVMLFILISLRLFVYNKAYIGLIIMLLVILTKSASFPFISWLLEAMRAPTPVRSLVHSSTLVAAGVWFSMRYDFNVFIDDFFIFSVLLIITIIITGLCCFYYLDLKKIVALSTCNNIAWCIFYLMFGDVILSLFQLISHGVSKCMLFMLVGDVMSGSSGSQARKGVYSTVFYKNWNIFSLICVVTGLSGVPFIGVFFTKHFLIAGLKNIFSFRMLSVILFCIFLSYFYSFRLCRILLKKNSRSSVGVEFFFKTSSMIYFWLCIKFFVSFFLDELNYLKTNCRIILIVFQMISCFTAYFLYKSTSLRKWRSRLFGCDKIVESSYNIYFSILNFVSIFFTRWDSIFLNKFFNLGHSSLLSFNKILLKILMIRIFFIFMCWCIVW